MYKLDNNLESKYIKMDGKPKSLQQIITENIKASEKLRCDINKETDIFRMLDMSLLCISKLTNDRIFYKQNREKVIQAIGTWNYK